MGYVEDANNAAIAALSGARWVSLHYGDPSGSGAAEAGGGRVATTWSVPAGGAIVGSAVQIPVPGGHSVSYWGLWNAQTGGDFLGGFRLVDEQGNWYSQTFDADGTFEFTPVLAAENTVALPGPKGASGTLRVGDVRTGEAGSDAVVVNSGSPSEAIFDFTIPQGIQGIQGEPGVQGEASTVPGPAGKTLASITWNASKHLIGGYTDNTTGDFGQDPVTSRTIAQGGISDLPTKATSWDAGLTSIERVQYTTQGINMNSWAAIVLDGGADVALPSAGWWWCTGVVAISEAGIDQVIGARLALNGTVLQDSHNFDRATNNSSFPSICQATPLLRHLAAGDRLQVQGYHSSSVGGQGTYAGFYGRSGVRLIRLGP